jgi:hypothetical protein
MGIHRAALPADLDTFATHAEAMARVAVAGLKVSPERLSAREKQFAESLLRHARGVKAAVAAWRQEIATHT